MILLDTSVLCLAFRRRHGGQAEPPVVQALRQMVLEDVPLAVPGIVLQEVLSGVRTDAHFSRLGRLLEAFPIVTASPRHHVEAARIANGCRRNGVVTSTVDCLIAALAITADARLFTLDADFSRMAPHCDLKLFTVEETRRP